MSLWVNITSILLSLALVHVALCDSKHQMSLAGC